MRLLILKKVALAKFQTIAGLQKKVPDQLLVYGIAQCSRTVVTWCHKFKEALKVNKTESYTNLIVM